MSDQDILEGGCLCGKVRYSITGIPKNVTHCHCEMCRKATGAAFATFAVIKPGRLEWTGAEPAFYASSDRATRGFCAACGSTLSFQYAGDEAMDIAVGTLDDPGAVTPVAHIWDHARLWWVDMKDGLPRYNEISPEREDK